MALKEYEYRGSTYKFEESKAPKGAKLINRKARTPQNKQATPENKSEK